VWCAFLDVFVGFVGLAVEALLIQIHCNKANLTTDIRHYQASSGK
jgi:hypothetical protein